jgi:uncharacterized RDD family membrane protein YckC
MILRRRTPRSRKDTHDNPYVEIKNAPLLQRFFAFILDLALIGLLAIFITTKFLLPQQYPDEYSHLKEVVTKYVAEVHQATEAKKETPSFPALSEGIQDMIIFANQSVLLLFWLYFGASSFLFGGGSLGKEVFGLTVVDAWSYQPIGVLQTIFRSGSKAFALFYFFPVLFIINFVMVFFNAFRFAGHDYFSRTRVVVESDLLHQVQEATREKEEEELEGEEEEESESEEDER